MCYAGVCAVQYRHVQSVVYAYYEEADNTGSIDSPGEAAPSVFKAVGPPPEDAESGCVIDLSNVVRQASICILLEEALFATYCEEVMPSRYTHPETLIVHRTSNSEQLDSDSNSVPNSR